MAIKTNYNFKGIEVKDATIRVIRLFGSSKDGWNSLVGVYNTTVEIVPEVEYKLPIGIPGENGYEPEVLAQEATTKEVLNLIEEFNHQASYKEDERGYVSVYNSLTEKFGGVEI